MHQLFPGQQESEKIYLVVREHWFHLFLKLMAWGLFVVILFAIDYSIAKYAPQMLEQPYIQYITLFERIYTILLIVALLLIWAIYYLSLQIVTNQRIVDIYQKSIFFHSTSELNLSQIEDVTSEIKGIFGTAFGYGNVYVQTAGTKEHFVFNNVPDADSITKLILDLYEKEKLRVGTPHH